MPSSGCTARLSQDRFVRLGLLFLEGMRDIHLKELVLEGMDDHRGMTVRGRKLINFGSDSFLGLDRHPHVQAGADRGHPAVGHP